MKLFLTTVLVAATGSVCLAKDPGIAAEPRYNQATTVDVRGVVTESHVVPAGKPLDGIHVTIKVKGETLDVYLAPPDFLNLLKTTVGVGDEIRAVGSRVNGDTVLTKEFFKKGTSIVLRDEGGAPVWQNWGVAADPATISQ